jgi:ribosomal protein S18 acetylase RimI-like enzyme
VRQAIETPSARAEIRSWPLDDSISHLVMADVSMVPTTDQVDDWLANAYATAKNGAASPPLSIRTGALYPAAARVFIECGFTVLDRLALLERPLLGSQPGRRQRRTALRRVRRRDLPELADIDGAAFPQGWRHDARSLVDIASATPVARSRLARAGGSTGRVVGFAITGKAGTTGYLQRLAVHPAAQRMGIGRQLVDDAVEWLMRRGSSRALVNTGVDNHPALRMYEQASFERLADELVVLEHRRTP